MVESTWNSMDDAASLSQLSTQLARVTGVMKGWEKNSFGSVKRELADLRTELERSRRSTLRFGPSRTKRQLMARISELLSREEVMERQRSRVQRIKEGDRNTSFFQAKSRERARINKINALKRGDGSIVTSQEELEVTAMEFYANLFTEQEVLDPGPILNCVPVKVMTEMNELLTQPFTVEEIRKAVFMMGTNKAPGPDGLTAGFYQVHWETLGLSITSAVLNFLNGGAMPESINGTTIVLIPKVKNP